MNLHDKLLEIRSQRQLNTDALRNTELNLDSVPCNLEACERLVIQTVLNACDWNQTQAAVVLGISRSTLWRKLDHHNLRDAALS